MERMRYLEFKLRYLENLKFSSIRVKELFEPKVLRKKADEFFSLFISIFLRNRSLSNVSVGKNAKLRREICI